MRAVEPDVLVVVGPEALGVANKQPFFQVKLTGLDQPKNGSSYIIWLIVGAAPKQ